MKKRWPKSTIWCHYWCPLSFRKGMNYEDIDFIDGDLTASQRNYMKKDARRERRRSLTIRSRDWGQRDHCGATRHVGKRNRGRKPKKPY
jgi:hypothetical protein